MKRFAVLLVMLCALAPSVRAVGPVTWPVPPCGPADVATASPAPALNDSASLSELPFLVGLSPASAALIVALNADGTTLLRCVYVNERSVGLEGRAILAVAGLKFATPRVPNTVVAGGRYLVRVSTLFGVSWVDAPPRQPLLPPCHDEAAGAVLADAPKPVERTPPSYPAGAEAEGIEGAVRVRLDVFANGAVSPSCIVDSSPPGWFEGAAVEALSHWRFNPPSDIGPRLYDVTVKFRMEN